MSYRRHVLCFTEALPLLVPYAFSCCARSVPGPEVPQSVNCMT
jgi:hypothetical protein